MTWIAWRPKTAIRTWSTASSTPAASSSPERLPPEPASPSPARRWPSSTHGDRGDPAAELQGSYEPRCSSTSSLGSGFALQPAEKPWENPVRHARETKLIQFRRIEA
jgi:hypothetical protein